MDNTLVDQNLAGQPDVEKTSSSNTKKIFLVILVILVLAVIGGGVYYYQNYMGKDSSTGKTEVSVPASPETSVSPTSNTPKKKTFFISMGNSALIGAKAELTFKTAVKSIDSSSGRNQLVTDIEGSDIPKFILTAETKIYKVTSVGKTPVKASELKVGQSITIVASYDVGAQTWKTEEVNIQ